MGKSKTTGSREAVVTFLEMKKRLRSVPPMPVNFHLALLKTSDMPPHYYRYLMDRVGRDWDWVNGLRYDDDKLKQITGSKNRDIRVLYLDGCPAGFFDIGVALPDHSEIVFFGLMPHATGLGLGRWFLGAAVEAAWSHNPEKLTLQTCSLDHPAALPLYQKMGFEPVSQKTEQVVPMTLAERAKVVMQ